MTLFTRERIEAFALPTDGAGPVVTVRDFGEMCSEEGRKGSGRLVGTRAA